MMQFRKKPVVIEAHQWFKNGDHPEDGVCDPEGNVEHDREGSIVRYYRDPDVPGDRQCSRCGSTMHQHGWIDTLEGGHVVCVGDWIIKGIQNEFCPCKPNIFEATYEPVG